MKVNIVNIYWIRANLHIVLDNEIKDKIYLKFKSKLLEIKNCKNNELIIPIYNFPEGKVLPNGEFELFSNNVEFILKTDNTPNKELFFNNKNSKYIVSFKNVNNKLVINNKSYNSFKFKHIIFSIVINFIYNVISIFNRKKDILFLNENSDSMRGNLEIFYNYLKDKYSVSKLLINIYRGSRLKNTFKELAAISKAKYIIIDNYTSIFNYLNLNRGQKLVQLWHAGVGFKSVGYARFGEIGSPHPKYCSHRKYDFAVVDNESLIEIYEEVFGISKDKFIVSGMPRLENYLNQEVCDKFTNEIFYKYNELKDRKVILYAPTYRGVGHKDAYYDMDKIDQDKLYDFCIKNNYSVIFKFHPFTNNRIEIKDQYKELLIDLTYEYDINDLLYISNILITDYSSCAYEASLLNRQILFYRYDKLDYESDRPMHSSIIFDKYKESLDFDSLLEDLNNIVKSKKDKIDKIKNQNNNSCETIEKKILKRK